MRRENPSAETAAEAAAHRRIALIDAGAPPPEAVVFLRRIRTLCFVTTQRERGGATMYVSTFLNTVVRGAAVATVVAVSLLFVPSGSPAGFTVAGQTRLAAGVLSGTLYWPDGRKATRAQVDVMPNGWAANDDLRGNTGLTGRYAVSCRYWGCSDVQVYLSDPCGAPYDIDMVQLTSWYGKDVQSTGGVLNWVVPPHAIARDPAGGSPETWKTLRAHISQCH